MVLRLLDILHLEAGYINLVVIEKASKAAVSQNKIAYSRNL